MHWFERPLFRQLEHAGILLAVLAVVFDVYWRFAVDRQIAQEERIERAWETVARSIPGESGKREAIDYLRRKNVSLMGIDLSCQAMEGGWASESNTCRRRTWLQGLTFSGSEDEKARLDYSNFSGTNLRDADFKFTNLLRVDFTSAWLMNAEFSNATIRMTNLSHANVSGAEFENASFDRVNISGTQFCSPSYDCATGMSPNTISTSWYWADSPPIFNYVDGYGTELFRVEFPELTSSRGRIESWGYLFRCDVGQRESYRERGGSGKPQKCKKIELVEFFK